MSNKVLWWLGIVVIGTVAYVIGYGAASIVYRQTIQTLPRPSLGTAEPIKKKAIDETKIPGGRYQGTQKIPILTYHWIREMPGEEDKAGQKLTVTPGNFERQMQWLLERGYQPVDFNALRANDLPAKPVIITFDDGYRDAYTTALPILQKFGFRGIFYIVPNWTSREQYLTWDQVKEISAAGMQIGSHTLTHANLTDKNLSPDQIKRQLTQSKKLIEDQIGQTVQDFCYPYGVVNNSAIDAVYGAGYKTATSTREGIVKKGAYLLYLDRIRVHDDSDFDKLINTQ